MVPRESSAIYRFGEFRLDSGAFRVSCGGVPVHLEPKAVDLLLYLLERPGLLVSKQELIDAVWKGSAVTDNAVTRVVAQLRRALHDPADRPRYIETVPTRGYRFIGTMAAGSDPLLPDRRTPPVQPRRPFVLANVGAAAFVTVIAALIVGLVSVTRWVGDVGTVLTDASAPMVPVRSLAILPFKNLSGAPEQDYLADGVSQALGDAFARLGTVAVASTTTSNRYRRTGLTSPAIARELGVDALLEGSVVRSGSHLRVSVAMVDGASGRRIWANTYDRTIADVLALYDEIAMTVAGEIKVAIDATSASRAGRHNRVHPEAYDDYLRGMFFLGNRWMAGGCRDAERSLLRAVERDPEFAPAYAALAWCYAYPARLGRDIGDVGPKAKAAVARALALDDRLALAHAVNGTVKWRIEYDAVGGELELRRALELDSSSALVLLPQAEFLLWRGSPERAMPLLDRALALDPFSPDRKVQVGFALLVVGRYQPAIAHFTKALELDPHYLTAQLWVAEAYGYLGDHSRTVAAYLNWLDGALRPERASAARTTLQRAYADAGWASFWQRELELAEEEVARPGSVWTQPYTRYTDSWFMARRYARLGRWDRALDALERAYTGRHHLMATVTLEPLFAPLRSLPRFRDLQRKTAGPIG